ncbi:hypothetical protein HanRHA438_Chr09g0395381 [Helianthus annuus]|nr:hypothetical protein HanIR_Chr09g0413901 [Helianthus annuus]KAJ0887834.1 hypothetical protein HanRHA438_Chr09g0395381 [Helianthus annuus]
MSTMLLLSHVCILAGRVYVLNRSYDMLVTFSCLNRSFRVTCLLTGSCSCLKNLTR